MEDQFFVGGWWFFIISAKNIVNGGKEVVEAICDHPDIKAVSFVGSTKVVDHEDADLQICWTILPHSTKKLTR